MTLFGHDDQVRTFRAAIASGRLHHAWLLAGPRGVGKARFADIAAAHLLARASGHPVRDDRLDIDPDHPTARLIAAGSHPDLQVVRPLINERGVTARSITVDQIRQVRNMLVNSTSQGDRRVIVIDAVDDLERGGSNALLKGLEEPPANTTFLLVSHSPGRLLPTIRSRCTTLSFRLLDDDVMTAALGEQLPDLDDEKRCSLCDQAAGSVATALAFAKLDFADIEHALERLATTGDADGAERSALSQALSLKAAYPRYEAFLSRAPAFIAARARVSQGAALANALTQWEAARALASVAISQSYVPEAIVIEIAGHVAALARGGDAAKA